MMAASARNNPKKPHTPAAKITHYGAKSHADKFWVYLTQIQQICPIWLSNKWRDRSTTSETLIYG